MRLKLRWVLLGLWLVVSAGCAPVKREDLIKEVTSKDPAFQLVLDKHGELISRIETYEREMGLRRTAIKGKIAQLKRELRDTDELAREKVEQVKHLMSPDRERLELDLSMASENLSTLRAQRANIARALTKLRKHLKEANPQISAQERAKQQQELVTMDADAARLDKEIQGVQDHLRLIKIKLMLTKI